MLSKFVDEQFPKIAKIVLCLFGLSIVYRAFLLADDCIAKKPTKNVYALVTAVVCLIPPFGVIVAVIDILTLALYNEFKYFVFKTLY